jgi:hypothetical protein
VAVGTRFTCLEINSEGGSSWVISDSLGKSKPFKGKWHIGEKFVVISSQTGMDEGRQAGCLAGEVGQIKWCIELKLVMQTLVFLCTYRTIGNIILTLSLIFTDYLFF